MVYSASAVQATFKYQSSYYFLYRQLLWAVMGTGLMLVARKVDYHQLKRPEVIWTLLGLSAILLVSVFFFPKRNGTYRWIALGHFTVQPSELAKLAIILFTAALLERRMHRINDVGYAVAPVALVAMLGAGLVVSEPDFGTSAVIVAVVAVMVFVAGLSYRYIVGGLLVLLPTGLLFVLASGYRRQRLMTYLHPESDPFGAGFQAMHAKFAVASGGAFGKGLMAGIEKLYYIPEPHTDFIYAVIGEELGLIGTTLVLICFAVIAWRGLRAALLAPDRFGSLLALGITTMIALQAFVNISVVTALFPTKGIPLPFVSNGGSSLFINLVAMGILLNISQQSSPTAEAAGSRSTGWTLEGSEAQG
jgi:cell division protein FtsW